MNKRSQLILEEEMKILFRGEDSPVVNRNISEEDIRKIRAMDIELIKAYMDTLDEKGLKRAKWTIENIKRQMNNESSHIH